MTTTPPEQMRNISLIAQGGAGKSALIETALFMAHEIDKPGTRARGDAVMATEPEEQEHGIDITPHVGHLTWKGVDVHIIDTPGYFSFLESTRGVLPGCDGAVVVFSAVDGVKPETKRLWKMLQLFEIPVIGFVTQLDHPRADFVGLREGISSNLKTNAIPLTLPIGVGESFKGVVDLLEQRGRIFREGKVEGVEIPSELSAEVESARTQLVEAVAESDDTLIERYLEGEELSSAELRCGLHAVVCDREFLPIYCGSGLHGTGVELLLDSIIELLPSPIERDKTRPFVGVDPSDEQREVTLRCNKEEPFSAIVLKTSIDRFSGKLSVVRVVSGSISSNRSLYNSSEGQRQKSGNIYILQGANFVQVEDLSAGDIGAIAKLEETHTGDTLCDDKHRVRYPTSEFSQPIVFYAVEADGNEEKVSQGLHRLVEEDPTLHYYRDADTNESILAGMGQAQIDIALERLTRKFSGKVRLRAPSVPYCETIKTTVQVQGKLKKQTGGHGQFADCWITMEPLERGAGFLFEDKITGGIIPKQYIPSIEKGIREAMNKGPLGGFPVTDFKVTLVDGSFHKVDSSDYAFQVAGSLALNAAVEKAEPFLLEPIMELQILVSDDVIGDVVKDVSGRRGRVLSMNPKEDRQEIHAEIPYAELLNYGNELTSITSGRGVFVMHLSHYSELPGHLTQQVLKGGGVEAG